MLKQLKIENFRCFKSFELNHLGKVNLLVGKNNSGKTSILEAIQLFHSRANFQSLNKIIVNRGEYLQNDRELDISCLFYGRKIIQGQKAIILAKHENEKQNLQLSILNNDIKASKEFINSMYWVSNMKLEEQNQYLNNLLQQRIEQDLDYVNKIDSHTFFLRKELYNLDNLVNDDNILRLVITGNSEVLINKFVASSSLKLSELLELFNKVVLTPEEDLVYQALQIIEPKIQRIAPIGTELKNNSTRGGFYVKLSDSDKRIPIGSMGDGVWRMLGLSLALVSAKDGVLLVDEIDTGLHYTALENMWKLIWETAKKLNIQVFATTHSRDCYEALEVLANRDDVGEEDISIQRIEKDTPRSVVYNKKGIATAAKREIEVR